MGVRSLPVQHRAYRDGRQCRSSGEEISSQSETDSRSQHPVPGAVTVGFAVGLVEAGRSEGLASL